MRPGTDDQLSRGIIPALPCGQQTVEIDFTRSQSCPFSCEIADSSGRPFGTDVRQGGEDLFESLDGADIPVARGGFAEAENLRGLVVREFFEVP